VSHSRLAPVRLYFSSVHVLGGLRFPVFGEYRIVAEWAPTEAGPWTECSERKTLARAERYRAAGADSPAAALVQPPCLHSPVHRRPFAVAPLREPLGTSRGSS